MASSIVVNGLRIWRSGVYGRVTSGGAGPGGATLSTGNVAVVGSFPVFEQGEPNRFTSADDVRDLVDDLELRTIAKCAFNPANDTRVKGAASLTFLNVAPNTQASFDLLDDASQLSVKFRPRVWGPRGNRVYVKAETNGDDANALDVTIAFEGRTEEYLALTAGNIATLSYTGALYTRSTASVSPSAWTWRWEIDQLFLAPGGSQSLTLNVSQAVVTGTLTLTLGLAAAQNVVGTIVGKRADGSSVTATATVLAGQLGPVTYKDGDGADVDFGSLTSLTVATTDAAYANRAITKGKAFDCQTAQFANVGAIVAFMAQYASRGFAATAVSPQIANIGIGDAYGGVDKQTDVNVLAPAVCTVRADRWAVQRTIDKASQLVSCPAVTAADLAPSPFGADPAAIVEGYMVGGSTTTAATDDWTEQLTNLEDVDINVIVPFTDVVAEMKTVRDHCPRAAVAGFERHAWAGAPADQSLATLYASYTSQLNSTAIGLVGQEVLVELPTNGTAWLAPKYLAVILAGMRAGVEGATPLTKKFPNVVNVRQSWRANRDANDAIPVGVCVLTQGRTAWQVERGVNTFLGVEDDPLCEESTVVSLNLCVRDLRANLNEKIGNPIFTGSAKRFLGYALAVLDEQVKNGLIKAHRNMTLLDLGDRFKLKGEVAPVEPLNFIEIEIQSARIAEAA